MFIFTTHAFPRSDNMTLLSRVLDATRSRSDSVFSLLSRQSSGIGEPSVYHALVVIFLEFFAWGLLTTPMITVRLKRSLGGGC